MFAFPVPGRGEIDVSIAYKIPRTVAELQTQAVATSKPKLQKSILSHAHRPLSTLRARLRDGCIPGPASL